MNKHTPRNRALTVTEKARIRARNRRMDAIAKASRKANGG